MRALFAFAFSILVLGCATEPPEELVDASPPQAILRPDAGPVSTEELDAEPIAEAVKATCDPVGHWFVSVHFGAGSCANLTKEHTAQDLNVYPSGEIVDLRYGAGSKWAGVVDPSTCTLSAVDGSVNMVFACNQDNPDEGDCTYTGVESIKWSVSPVGNIVGTGVFSLIRAKADGSEPPMLCWQAIRVGGFKYPLLF